MTTLAIQNTAGRGIIDRMTQKKKKISGKHKMPRKAVQLPVEWITLARKLAAKQKTPTMWWIVSLIEAAAKADGTETTPVAPWEEHS